MSAYRTYLCGVPTPCPKDANFEHDHYYGCVPLDFSTATGLSKKHRQRKVADATRPGGYRYAWDGGCDAHRA